jgi:radical SAM protein with 4Fe4S-binding SPASM domain
MRDPEAIFLPRFPLHMVWLATNLCNARCLHCSSNSGQPMPGELDTREALDMLDQLAGCGVVDLAVSGGEPLLRRDLLDVVAHAKQLGLSVGIGSNGAKLTEAQARALAALGLDRLQVSLDGFGAAHDSLRRWPGLFERALRTIALARDAGLRVHVCFTITRFNVDEIEDMAALAVRQGVKRLNLSRFVATGRGTAVLELPDEAWQDVIRRCQKLREQMRPELEVVTHLAQQVLVDEQAACMPAFIGCQAGVAQGCIQADGTVFPCVLLPVAIGNIRTQRFAQMWQGSPIIAALRDRSLLQGPCGTCGHRARCGGCRAVAYARTGNMFASDPRCWLPSSSPQGPDVASPVVRATPDMQGG